MDDKIKIKKINWKNQLTQINSREQAIASLENAIKSYIGLHRASDVFVERNISITNLSEVKTIAKRFVGFLLLIPHFRESLTYKVELKSSDSSGKISLAIIVTPAKSTSCPPEFLLREIVKYSGEGISHLKILKSKNSSRWAINGYINVPNVEKIDIEHPPKTLPEINL